MICDDKLLPCPFCGSTKLLLRNLEMETSLFYLTCNDCNVEVQVPLFKAGQLVNNHKRLVDTWNSRAYMYKEDDDE